MGDMDTRSEFVRTRRAVKPIGVLCLLLVTIGAQQPRPNLTPAQVKEYVGQTATVCGRVTMVACAAAASPLLLTLASDAPESVSVRILAADRPLFEPRRRFVERDVCATGPVERLGSAYLVGVRAPSDLQLAGESRRSAAPGQIYDGCDPNVTPPTPIRRVGARYPIDALQAKITGRVMLEGVVQTDGTVGEVRVVTSLNAKLGFDAEAVTALKAWLFAPAVRSGQPVPFFVNVEMEFLAR